VTEHAHDAELIFEPHALRQRWSVASPLEPGAWAGLFGEYLTRLAAACTDAGPCVIGHIKLLALFPGQEYLRVSVVSATHAPTVTGAVPAGLAEVTLTLNVLVYGLPHDRLAALTSATAADVAERWAATLEEQAPIGSAPHAEGEEHVH
jgi:hypothetical protein